MMKTSKWVTVILSAAAGAAAMYVYTLTDQSDLSKLRHAITLIERGYLEPVNRSKLIDGAIEGMLASLDDPYTTYMDQEEAAAFYESINASFEGIGATMEEVEGRIVVVAPIKGSPAEKAGLNPGDQVIKVGDQSLEGMDVHEAVMLIRGKKGTKAELTILRDGKEVNISIIRDTIPIETVYSEMKEDQIGVIRISSFAETTFKEYEEAVQQLISEGMQGLIIDLRQNPGGLTDAAESIAETIVPNGKPIVQFKRRNVPVEMIESEYKNIGLEQIPIVALIDEGSASAAEILAGALQQSADVPLIGMKSFGKGTAQVSQPLQDGPSIKFTIAEWLAPDGSSIHKKGLIPDIEVSLPEYANLPFINDDLVMKENEFSDEIRTVQTMLQTLGFDPGRNDGFYDSDTTRAVKKYQGTKGIEPTGVVQGETTRALISDIRERIAANDTQLEKALQLIKETRGEKP